MKRITNTPCPVAATHGFNFDDTITDDITNIEFTTAFDASFKNVKPRRGHTTRINTTNFAIHEDVEPKTAKQQTTASHPAKRTRPSDRPSEPHVRDERATLGKLAPVQAMRQAKRGGISIIHTEDHATEYTTEESKSRRGARGGSCVHGQKVVEPRAKRRDTLYIPTDNTTQPTMWMGIFSPLKQQVCEGNECGGADDADLTGIAAKMVRKRGSGATVVESKARRKPLQPSKASSEQANTINDQAGEPTGKENYPPVPKAKRIAPNSKPLSRSADVKLPANTYDVQRKSFLSNARLQQLSRPKTVPGHPIPDILTMYEIGTHSLNLQKPSPRRKLRDSHPQPVADLHKPAERRRLESSAPAQMKSSLNTDNPSNPAKSMQSCVEGLPLAPIHVPIIEHIENPSLYEENWLDHQEIVITQLLNVLIKQGTSFGREEPEKSVLRAELVNRYNGPEVHLIYNRAQAAILYGSLSLSHEAMFNLQNLVHDVGRKKAFIKFWLNYNTELLQVALETVSGKRMPVQDQTRSSGAKSSPVDKMRSVVQFIESYLLRHEDGQFKPAGTGSVNDLGSKTLLKCIMLMKALDMIKDNTKPISSQCLFRKASPIKSSLAAVQYMMRMLNPSVGDPIRALRQLGYEVFHIQNPSDDVTYGIDNLAIDMRDGVHLARLVEMLLYESKAGELSMVHDDECQTIYITDGETVDIDNSQPWPLTQHLKLPCPSRVSKIWNVGLSLEILRGMRSMKPLLEEIDAAAIVDGYREQTIKLLWMIVGQFGLAHLIDSIDLTQEIRRLKPPHAKANGVLDDDSSFTSAQGRIEHLVKAWARAVATSRGLRVRNFSTSFADGQVFRAVLDEYEPYLCEGEGSSHLALNLRLSRLGCSRQFADLFDNRSGGKRIIGKDFVVAALVFLCSRVMEPSKLGRNAVKIQRCWRKHWSEVAQKRQAVKKKLAYACAAVVYSRQGVSESIETGTNVDQLAGLPENSETGNDIWLSV